jgi:hypothetical protein
MIEKVVESIVKDLDPTGLLVLGLYWALGRPLSKMARGISRINEEIGEIIKLLIRMDERYHG